MPPMSLLHVHPDKTLEFTKNTASLVYNQTSELILKNTSIYVVAFRVRTTAPKGCLVKPSSGVIQGKQQQKISIYRQHISVDNDIVDSHRFVVHAVNAVRGETPDQNFWNGIRKDQIQEQRLGVLVADCATNADASNAAAQTPERSPDSDKLNQDMAEKETNARLLELSTRNISLEKELKDFISMQHEELAALRQEIDRMRSDRQNIEQHYQAQLQELEKTMVADVLRLQVEGSTMRFAGASPSSDAVTSRSNAGNVVAPHFGECSSSQRRNYNCSRNARRHASMRRMWRCLSPAASPGGVAQGFEEEQCFQNPEALWTLCIAQAQVDQLLELVEEQRKQIQEALHLLWKEPLAVAVEVCQEDKYDAATGNAHACQKYQLQVEKERAEYTLEQTEVHSAAREEAVE